MTKQENSTDIPITLEELISYFKSLLDCTESSGNCNNPPCVEPDEILDQPIEEEVRVAIQELKRNKAPGMDGLLPGIFKSFNRQLTSFITALFNKLIEQETFPDAWSTGIIKPIYTRREIKRTQIMIKELLYFQY